jgi:uncharacterized protein
MQMVFAGIVRAGWRSLRSAVLGLQDAKGLGIACMRRLFRSVFAMRHLLLLFCLLSSLGWGAPYSPESVPNQRLINGSHVSDPDEIIGAESAARIDALLVTLEQKSSVQVAVVALESIGQNPIFDFAQQLFVSWGLGSKARDDGLLVLLVKDQRTVRLHTGYGLEGVLPDVVCKRIEREFMVPHFREGRYGEGLVAGVSELDRLLGDPAALNAPVAPRIVVDSPWTAFLAIVGAGGAVVLLVVFGVKSMFGYFSDAQAHDGDTPISMRYSRLAWLSVFIGLPALIFGVVHLVRPPSPILTCLLALYIYYMLVALQQIWCERRLVKDLWRQKSYLQLYRLLDQTQGYWAKIAVLFPLPFLFFWIYHGGRQAHFRNAPRPCGKCSQPMRKLDESEEDAYLSAGQQKEETLHAVEHDVWLCAACQTTERWACPGTSTSFTRCPNCKNQTLAFESNAVLLAATEGRAGPVKEKWFTAAIFVVTRSVRNIG